MHFFTTVILGLTAVVTLVSAKPVVNAGPDCYFTCVASSAACGEAAGNDPGKIQLCVTESSSCFGACGTN
ncbi:hypothetical protein GALMADRAFT_145732 [Galerina marginata CBS 339.88]|uniref:Extracellular membrane protein CFEM domain-containing protein n=1 Tax=Galerina marginata (strain CBS 339.88) TaxID=685588 RepID=A0A067SG74_GALM3|nr:hypothetical protein GALMADRAFT_145732 [Galerina marginata CBS 339.88]